MVEVNLELQIHGDNPKLFEFDSKNKVIDVFVRPDPECPFPFTNGDWFHQGFDIEEFVEFLKGLCRNNDLGHRIFILKDV